MGHQFKAGPSLDEVLFRVPGKGLGFRGFRGLGFRGLGFRGFGFRVLGFWV